MKIILDAMGGDNAPMAPVMGAVQAAKDFGGQGRGNPRRTEGTGDR